MEYQFILYKYMLVICTFGSIKCDDGETHIKNVCNYDGTVDVISCNGNDVINITDIKLTNHPTDCSRNTCNLTDNDRYLVESCNGNSSCEIPIDDMSPCVKDRGFYSVDYSCQRHAIHCDFEDVSCEWLLAENGWSIANAKDQDPKKDHTTGSEEGRYWFVRTDNSNKTFLSQLIPGSSKQCLTFYYYIHYSDESIMLYLQHMNGTRTHNINIYKPDNRNLWNKYSLPINAVMKYKLAVQARGDKYHSKFAIDDITIMNTDCEELTECDFEVDWCNWTISKPGPWYRISRTTKSHSTGPLKDHTTTGDKGYYAYMEASEMKNNEKAYFTSPIYSGTGEMCFVFWYCMYGDQMGSLRVHIVSNNKTFEVFTKSSDQGRLWLAAFIDIHVNGTFIMIIEGQRGNGSKSDIAVDDLTLRSGNCEGIVKHQQKCKRVDEKVELNQCSNHYLSNIRVDFDPSKESCRKYLDENTNSICNNSSNTVLCDVGNVTRECPSCLNRNNLVIEYTCTDSSKILLANSKSNDKTNAGLIVGVVAGLLLVVGLTFGALFIIRRRRKSQGTAKNKSSTNDYAVSWNSASERTTLHAAQPLSEETNHAVGLNRITNNPSYGQGYITTSSNELSTKQDTEYMNVPEPDGTPKHKNFKVLDPAETGLNCTNQNEYELALAIDDSVDDNYAETGVGVYDISGNNRHKEKEEDTIYDHSVDDTYDTSNRGRQEDLGDYTYNHVFGKHTEDEYDIAVSS